jgi:hypothetical protein
MSSTNSLPITGAKRKNITEPMVATKKIRQDPLGRAILVEQNSNTPFLFIPPELIGNVLFLLPARQAHAARLVCVRLYGAVKGAPEVDAAKDITTELERLRAFLTTVDTVPLPHSPMSTFEAVHFWVAQRGMFLRNSPISRTSIRKFISHLYHRHLPPANQIPLDTAMDVGAKISCWTSFAQVILDHINWQNVIAPVPLIDRRDRFKLYAGFIGGDPFAEEDPYAVYERMDFPTGTRL